MDVEIRYLSDYVVWMGILHGNSTDSEPDSRRNNSKANPMIKIGKLSCAFSMGGTAEGSTAMILSRIDPEVA